MMTTYEEKDQTDPGQMSQVGELNNEDQEIDILGDTSCKYSMAYQNNSDLKYENQYLSLNDHDNLEYMSARDCFNQSLKKDSIFEGPDAASRAQFNNFYHVEISEQKEIIGPRHNDGSCCRVHLFGENSSSIVSRIKHYSELSARRIEDRSVERKRDIHGYAKYGKDRELSEAPVTKISENRVVECVSTFLETLGELINKLPQEDRMKTLNRLKSDKKLRSLLESPASQGKEFKGLEYFTFNDLELSVKQIDVVPLEEIKLQSLGGDCKEERISISTADNEFRDSRSLASNSYRTGKMKKQVESIYHSGHTSDSFLNQASTTSNQSGISHEKLEPKIVIKTRGSKYTELGCNKENERQLNRSQHLSTLSLQDALGRPSKGYLKGNRLN